MPETLQEPQPKLAPAPQPQHQGDDAPRHGRGRMIGWIILPFVVFGLIAVYSLVERRTEHRVLAEQTARFSVPYVSVIHATPLASVNELVLTGNINSYVNSPIYARTNGYLMKWYKDIGAHVKQGDLLADIDTPEIDQQLAQARADLNTAKANAALAEITAKRYQGLLSSDAVSQQEVDNYNGDYAAKQAMVQSAQANVERLEALESFKKVYAPFSGVITARNVDIGTLINAGNGGTSTKEMFDLAQTDPLRVYISVPESFSPSIRGGMKACLELTEYPGEKFCGTVVRTSESIDPNTRTLLTEVDVPNPKGILLQGAYAQVHFDARVTGQHLSLPINALLFRPEGTLAAVVNSDNTLSLHKLTIGRDLGNSVEVLEGITRDDNIVVNPPDSLENGEKVAVTPANQNGAAN